MDNRHAVREMRIAILELSINLTTGELLDIERVTSSSERGGWKRAGHFSTSLAAYSTFMSGFVPAVGRATAPPTGAQPTAYTRREQRLLASASSQSVSSVGQHRRRLMRLPLGRFALATMSTRMRK